MERLEQFKKWLKQNKKIKNKKAKQIADSFEQVEHWIADTYKKSIFSVDSIQEFTETLKVVDFTECDDIENSNIFNRYKSQYEEFLKTSASVQRKNIEIKKVVLEENKKEIVEINPQEETLFEPKEKELPIENVEVDNTNQEDKEQKPTYAGLSDEIKLIKDNLYQRLELKKIESNISKTNLLTTDVVSFDMLNNTLYYSEDNNDMYKPTAIFFAEGDKFYRVDNKAIANNLQTYSLFDAFRKKNNTQVYTAINRIINDAIKSIECIANNLIYYIPDVLDEFQKDLRRTMVVPGIKAFPMPRSIATMLYYQNNNFENFKPYEKIAVIDMDGNESSVVNIEVKQDKQTRKLVFVRKGIQKINIEKNYESFCRDYLNHYNNKYYLGLSEHRIDEIISMHLMDNVFENKTSFDYFDKDEIVKIQFDEYIFASLKKEYEKYIKELIKSLPASNKAKVIFSILSDHENGYINFKKILGITREIDRRIKMHEPLWEEYLPKLQLRVVKNGRYDFVNLISGNNTTISVNTVLDSEHVFENVEPLFIPKNEEKITLPLIKDSFSKLNSEKLACFTSKKILPLSEDTKVDLKVYYKYGDENSYRIVAVPHADNPNAFSGELPMEWIDATPLSNDKYPEFMDNQVDMDDFDNAYSHMMFDFDKMLQKIERIERGDYYELNKSQKNYLSKTVMFDRFALILYKKFTVQISEDSEKYSKYREIIEMASKIFNKYDQYYISEDNYLNMSIGVAPKDVQYRFEYDSRYFLCNSGTLLREHKDTIMRMIEDAETGRYRDVLDFVIFMSREKDTLPPQAYKLIEKAFIEAKDDKEIIARIRNVSAVCWYSSEWIKSLYQNSEKTINILIDFISNYILKIEKKDVSENAKGYFFKTLGELFEVLLCICRLKEINPLILDVNDYKTKELVNHIIRINSWLPESVDIRCRIQANLENKKELYNTCDLCYMLIKCLTGDEKLTLLSFKE